MKTVSLRCPECGAALDSVRVTDGKINTFCVFCGHHIIMEDENTRLNINRTVDEARLKELELERENMAHQEAKRQEFLNHLRKKRDVVRMMFLIALVVDVILYILAMPLRVYEAGPYFLMLFFALVIIGLVYFLTSMRYTKALKR